MSDRRDRRLSAALVAIALVGAVVGSVGAPLITSVATDLAVSSSAAQWTLTITLLTGAIAAPVLGRLGSGPRRRETIVGTLVLVSLGGVLTALPLPFAFLLTGRALQGLAVAVIALLMSVARAHLPADRSTAAVSTLSVASTVGIGVGYPAVSLIDQLAGLRAAYGLGLALSIVATVLAWRLLPREQPGESPRVDLVGAALLAVGLAGVLMLISEPALWRHRIAAAAVGVGAVVVLAAWARHELRAPRPLVDLRILTRRSVAAANIAMLLVATGLYLLFSLLIRYVQTPSEASYGLGLAGVGAGAALIPFSLLGFAGGNVLPHIVSRISDGAAYAAATATAIAGSILFIVTINSLVSVLVSFAVLGFAVGVISALMPRLVLAGVPDGETSSVLSMNQVVRSIGFSAGSAFAGMLLAVATPAGQALPTQSGYVVAALCSIPLVVGSAVIIGIGGRRSV